MDIWLPAPARRIFWGPFENNPNNPVLTNRNKAPEIIQGIGHGDLVQSADNNWHIVTLGFRQIHPWMQYHNLGREIFLTPITFHENGWFTAGIDGTTDVSYEISGNFLQDKLPCYTFANTDPAIDWCYISQPEFSNYAFSPEQYILHGSKFTLDTVASPAFIGMRQRDFNFELHVQVSIDTGEAGVTTYMCENEHYDIAIRKTDTGCEAVLKLNIGGIKHIQNTIPVTGTDAVLIVRADHFQYNFFVQTAGKEQFLGSGQTKYLSSEVSGGFTGTMLALYAVGENTAKFRDFSVSYM